MLVIVGKQALLSGFTVRTIVERVVDLERIFDKLFVDSIRARAGNIF